jgi:hypothetical protein
MELSNVLNHSLYEHSIYIYVIRQECGKYFVGKTNTPSITIQEIKQMAIENKQQWILQYRPAQIIEIINSHDPWDEDKITLKYMNKYGIENVRGGSFNSFILSPNEFTTIRNMIFSAKGKCPICNLIGHNKQCCPMVFEFNDYEVVIFDNNDIILTTEPKLLTDDINLIKNKNQISDTSSYLSNTLLSIATTTNSLFNSWFRSGNKSKCLRCGMSGHKTGNCINELEKKDE